MAKPRPALIKGAPAFHALPTAPRPRPVENDITEMRAAPPEEAASALRPPPVETPPEAAAIPESTSENAPPKADATSRSRPARRKAAARTAPALDWLDDLQPTRRSTGFGTVDDPRVRADGVKTRALTLHLPVEQLEALDTIRGKVPRNRIIEAMIRRCLQP